MAVDNAIIEKKTVKVKKVNNAVERDIVINGTHIRIKSVFNGNIPLEKALGNIAVRKLAKNRK